MVSAAPLASLYFCFCRVWQTPVVPAARLFYMSVLPIALSIRKRKFDVLPHPERMGMLPHPSRVSNCAIFIECNASSLHCFANNKASLPG